MPRNPKPDYVEVKEPCTGTHAGAPFVLNRGEAFVADHELVRAYPEFFKPLDPRRQRPAVEQMTAAPGEKRGARAAGV